jgi:4a-hydroxytetrahydrobiopterin dehydratase
MWNEQNNTLTKEFVFKDFKEALAFVNRIGAAAEKQNHHPDIQLSWGKVVVRLQTHSEQAITQKDRQLADTIDAL